VQERKCGVKEMIDKECFFFSKCPVIFIEYSWSWMESSKICLVFFSLLVLPCEGNIRKIDRTLNPCGFSKHTKKCGVLNWSQLLWWICHTVFFVYKLLSKMHLYLVCLHPCLFSTSAFMMLSYFLSLVFVSDADWGKKERVWQTEPQTFCKVGVGEQWLFRGWEDVDLVVQIKYVTSFPDWKWIHAETSF